MLLGIGIGLGVLVLLWLITAYNALVRTRNETQNAWAQIDVQLKRRHDLVPNLVETAKGYMEHERETLTKVIEARNQAVDATGPAAHGAAEGLLGMALRGFFALVENYPDLKANQNFLSLQEELASTENRIAFARQAYNDAATDYNNRREMFPSNMVASAYSFERAEYFEIDEADERTVPKIEV